MPETPTGPEQSRQQPIPAGAASGRPGYPPPGQSDALAAVAAAEAAERPADADALLEGELAALDGGVETPADRTARLGTFVEQHFSDIVPVSLTEPAVEECCRREDQLRDLFEEPDLVMTDEDAEDPVLRQRLEAAVAVAENDETIAARNAAVDEREALTVSQDRDIEETAAERAAVAAAHPEVEVPATQAERETALAESQAQTGVARTNNELAQATNTEAGATNTEAGATNTEAGATNTEAGARNIEVARDLQTVEELNNEFERIKAANGGSTIAALETLLDAENGLQNPDMRAIVQRAISTARALVTAIPGKEAALGRLLDQSGLNLAAGSQMAMFAGVLSAAEASDEFSDEEVEQLRTVLAGSDEAIRTGTDFENAMQETVLDADGNEIPAHTAGEPLGFGVGLEGFTSDDGETQYMRATPEHGQGVTLDVTHLSPEEKAVMASFLDTWRMTEDAGASEWLLNLTQYDLHGQNIVDPIKLIEAAQVVNAVYGGFAGYNGEVLHGPEQVGMIRWQAQLASPKGDAARSDRNTSMTASAMMGLGIQDENGNLDLDMLRAFGEYSRENWFSAPDYEAVQAHLVGLFPEKFARLNAPAVGRGSQADLAA